MAGRFSLEAVFKALDAFSAPMAKMEARVAGAVKRMQKSFGSIDRANARVSEGLQRAAIAGAATGVAFGFAAGNVIGAGADFEQAIADVGAVSLMTRSEVSDLEKKALELGSTTKFSAKEVAAGMELMGRAGFTNVQILETIPGVLAAAAAEGMELSDAAGIISNVLHGMGLEVSQTGRVADVLALASARTNASIMSLGEGMASASATAKQFRIPLEDTVAAVALLQDVGIGAEESGTAIKTMLTKLAAPSTKARAEMTALGISFEDMNHNMLPLPQILEQFQKAAQKSGGNMKTVAFFSELVGLRGEKAALSLKDLFASGKVGDLTRELQGAQGSAEKMAKLRMNTFQGDVSMLGKAFDALKISVFDMNSKGLRGAVQGTTAWLNANKELIKTGVQNFIVSLVRNLPTIVAWLGRIGAAIVIFYAWSLGVKAASIATAVLSFAIEALTFVMNGEAIAAAAATAWTWLRNAAVVAYTAVLWLGTAAIAAWSLATSASTYNAILANAIMIPLKLAFLAYNAVVAAGAVIIDVYNAGGLLAVARLGLWTLASWAAVAAQAALNLVMSLNPAFLVGAGLLILIGVLLKVSGAWDWLKAKISGFASGALAYIQPVIDKVMAFYNALKKAASFVGGAFDAATGGTPPGFIRAPAEGGAPLLSPSDGVTKSIEESNFVSRGEVTIKDETGRAEVTTPAGGPGFSLNLQPSGAFGR